MCGIVAVLARRARRPPVPPSAVGAAYDVARRHLASLSGAGPAAQATALSEAARALRSLDALLRGVPGLTCFAASPAAPQALSEGSAEVEAVLSGFEETLDREGLAAGTAEVEALNAALVEARDANWALGHDRFAAARDVLAMAKALGAPLTPAALGALWAVHVALRSLSRLEVRGRDSAGLHLMLEGHRLGLAELRTEQDLGRRFHDPVFANRAVRVAGGCLSLVYKVAAEVGELGDNVAALREAISSDVVLARALRSPELTATAIGHTRWASVGLIAEPNAHPLNSDEAGRPAGPYVVGALNGDIDNYLSLISSEGVVVPPEVTTDAKLVPVLISHELAAGRPLAEAFRLAVGKMDGSVGIAANAAVAPNELFLALRGSGQSLNVGLAEDAYVVASEPYGLVEEASRYLRMEGNSGGEVVICRREGAGTLEGLSRYSYAGEELPVATTEIRAAEVTTRDVARRGFRHFFLKEISESPSSVRKTLRGKLVDKGNGELVALLGEDALPASLAKAVEKELVREVIVVGQGTAAVAGQGIAAAISTALPGVQAKAMPATELSGWGLEGAGLPDDMSEVLVVVVSQSGTTTDTNRAVDLARGRGAHVVSIVNRRNSDLAQKSHGVLYTSDGRDVEMSVASTKAFYSQVVAGHLLAAALAEASHPTSAKASAQAGSALAGLRELPRLMEEVLARRGEIGRVASAVAPPRRCWAVVGSGPDRVAAAEVRIKLSELCYKTIGADTIEDKKHIDLSAEPMMFVCAASAAGTNASDIAREVDIFRAHRAAPVVVATEGEEAFKRIAAESGVDVIWVPRAHPRLAFLLSAMAGHIFGYEAALAIDEQARPFRQARALLEAHMAAAAGAGSEVRLERLWPEMEAALAPALSALRSGAYDGHLNASTATRLATLVGYASGTFPIEGYEAEAGRPGAPESLAVELIGAFTRAIDELTRPIDAIKHQAKTVTVGTSRSERALLEAPLVLAVRQAGTPLESLGYRALRTLAALGAAVEEVLGYTRYAIEETAPGQATIDVVDRGGVALGIRSRTEEDHTLRGTKHRVAETREVTAFRGLHDGRTGIMVPEVKDGDVTGITLLHARFAEFLAPEVAKAVLTGYQGRYTALVDAVTEGQPRFDDEVLARIQVADLLTQPVAVLARYWAEPGRAEPTARSAGAERAAAQ
jgi:glucosamine--fructose-6-phosphate aminotransferase (isomerizing)